MGELLGLLPAGRTGVEHPSLLPALQPGVHGYVERLGDWRWSSFSALLAAQGEQALRGVFREHREFHELELPADTF